LKTFSTTAVIQQILVPAGICILVDSIIGLERPQGNLTEADVCRVRITSLGGNALLRQVGKCEAQGKRHREILPIVEKQQATTHHPVIIDNDIRKTNLPGTTQDRRPSDMLAAIFAELLDNEYPLVAGEQLVQVIAARWHWNITIQINANGARLVGEEFLQYLDHVTVRQRPLCERLDIFLNRLNKHDARFMHTLLLSQTQVDIVGRQFDELDKACATQPDNDEARD
jgi:hypothetical protein